MPVDQDERDVFLDAAFVETVEALPDDEKDMARQIFLKCRGLFLHVASNFAERAISHIVKDMGEQGN